jgi:hemolysin activation/secretion protein
MNTGSPRDAHSLERASHTGGAAHARLRAKASGCADDEHGAGHRERGLSMSKASRSAAEISRPLLAAWLVSVIGVLPVTTQAATLPQPPGAGSILQQVQPVTPPPPASNDTGLTIEPAASGKPPPSAPFLVKTLLISGNMRFDTSTLHALVAQAEGRSLTLPELHAFVARLSDYYHVHGYPLARAIVPAQTITSGIVRIDIIEARYGQIALENSSRVTEPLLHSTLSSLQSGQPIEQRTLDHALLLLSDIPGIAVNATLKPGEAVGTSDLAVTAAPTPAFVGSAALDNFGNHYTGRTRISGTLETVNPLRHGDVLSLSGLSSGGDMNYGRLGYDTLLDGAGTRVGIAYSALHYRLGDPLSALDAHGTAEVTSLWAKQPLVRTPDLNLYGQLQYDRLQLHDHIDASAIVTDRHLGNVTASVLGDARDTLLSGVTSWSIGITRGQVEFDNAAARAVNAVTARSEGHFTKWTANLDRLQTLGAADSLYLAVSGQWADRNLDASQQMVEGGIYTVRSYDMGALSADTAYLETVELRHELGTVWQGRWQALVFVDSAQVTVNKNPWEAGKNSASLSGAGVGLNWAGPHGWNAKADIAARLGATPELVADTSSVRAWIELDKAF